MQMQLGSFRFEAAAGTEAASQEIARSRQWVRRGRLGRPPYLQDQGRDAAGITLTGSIPVTSRGRLDALEPLRVEAGLVDTDSPPEPLILLQADGAGTMRSLGLWVVERLVETGKGPRTGAGIPAVIEFTISLLDASP